VTFTAKFCNLLLQLLLMALCWRIQSSLPLFLGFI
jgi:hypothetical protein